MTLTDEEAREIVKALRAMPPCAICGGAGYVGGGCNYETGDCDPGQPCDCTGNGSHAPNEPVNWAITLLESRMDAGRKERG